MVNKISIIHKILNILRYVLAVILIIISTFIIINPKGSLLFINDSIYKITGKSIFFDPNERINYDEIMKIAKNKDYSNSIYYPYFELLNDDQKEEYNELVKYANEYNTSYEPTIKLSNDDFREVLESVLYDHPEIFWLDSTYSVLVDQNEMVQKVLLQYTYIVTDIENARKRFDDEIDKIVKVAKVKESDYEKELYVHNKLISLIEYDENRDTNLTTYDAIIYKKAICDSYTKLFQIIMTKLGIPTYYIVGNANEKHSWNLVELEDGFYNVDVTWDDQKERIIYRYFNINDDMISSDHTREGLSTKINVKNGTKYLNVYSPLK